jgi:hypothetical protein
MPPLLGALSGFRWISGRFSVSRPCSASRLDGGDVSATPTTGLDDSCSPPWKLVPFLRTSLS